MVMTYGKIKLFPSSRRVFTPQSYLSKINLFTETVVTLFLAMTLWSMKTLMFGSLK